MRDRRKEYAEIIRPDDDSQDAGPKTQLQETYSEKPRHDPYSSGQSMVFYFDVLHMPIVAFLVTRSYRFITTD